MKVRHTLLAPLILVLASNSQGMTPFHKAQSWIDTDQSELAYEWVLQQIDEYEGDPEFDMIYGTAAVDIGNFSEAVFALERVVLVEPKNMLAKLELARAYYHLGQKKQAETLFNEVLAVNPPDLVKQRIDAYLVEMQKVSDGSRHQLAGFVELWSGYDTNLNLGPDSQPSVVILSPSALDTRGRFDQVKLGGSYSNKYDENRNLAVNASVDYRRYPKHSDRDYAEYQLGVTHSWSAEDRQYQLGARTKRYHLDDRSYRDQNSLILGWNEQLSERSVLRSSLTLSDLMYELSDYKDAYQTILNSTYIYAGKGKYQPLGFASLFVGNETPKTSGILADAEIDRSLYGVSLGLSFNPTEVLSLTPSWVYQVSDYKGEDWLYRQIREDKYMGLNLSVEWEINPSLSLLMNLSSVTNQSNLNIYEYDRDQVMLGGRFTF